LSTANLWLFLHRAADAVDRQFGWALRQTTAGERGWVLMLDGIVARQTDRRYLRDTILPALRRAKLSRALIVGVRRYSAGLEAAFDPAETECWTCDIDPAVELFGAPGAHVIQDVRSLDQSFPPGFFDLVVLNGVFGWGVDKTEDMNAAVKAIQHVLAPGGYLLIGWNADRTEAPDTLTSIAGAFAPANLFGLPHRKSFSDVTHVYAWFRKSR
jgi:SAM-dependent methyltransferase